MNKTITSKLTMIGNIMTRYNVIADDLLAQNTSIEKRKNYLIEVNNILLGLRVYLRNEKDPIIAREFGKAISSSEKLISLINEDVALDQMSESIKAILDIFAKGGE